MRNVVTLATGILIGFLAAVGFSGRADDWLTTTCCSLHLKAQGQNWKNLGGGIARDLSSDTRLVLGGYDNSSNNASFYAGVIHQPWRYERLRFGTTAALVTGYRPQPIPLVGPTITYELRNVRVNVLFIPAAGGVIAVGAEWRF